LNGRWQRVHQEDLCQALGVHPSSKYENEGGPGFADIMSVLEASGEPEADRDRMMKTACLVYLLAATDAHSKNYSLLYGRDVDRPNMRLAPLYDIASAWPYQRQIPPQKMKLAMRIGKHYRMREIQTRHFVELARACRYPVDRMIDTLKALSEQLPDEALELGKDFAQDGGLASEFIIRLVDKLAAQCRATRRNLHAKLVTH